MSGFDNEVVYGKNADFSSVDNQNVLEANGLATNGQLWIGSTALNAGSTHINVGAITSPDSSVMIGYASPNITLITNGAVIPQTLSGDSGGALSPTDGNFNILGLSGSKTSGSVSTLTIKSPPFSQIGGSGTSVLNTGEFVTATATRTLPVSAGLSDGDLFIFYATTANVLTIQAVGAQKIRIGNQLSSAAGTAASNAIGDSVTLRFDATQGFFLAVSVVGTWTLA